MNIILRKLGIEQSSASDANSTENARKQKQGDKRTSIKNMTEMYNNTPAPDYMKQLATIIGMD